MFSFTIFLSIWRPAILRNRRVTTLFNSVPRFWNNRENGWRWKRDELPLRIAWLDNVRKSSTWLTTGAICGRTGWSIDREEERDSWVNRVTTGETRSSGHRTENRSYFLVAANATGWEKRTDTLVIKFLVCPWITQRFSSSVSGWWATRRSHGHTSSRFPSSIGDSRSGYLTVFCSLTRTTTKGKSHTDEHDDGTPIVSLHTLLRVCIIRPMRNSSCLGARVLFWLLNILRGWREIDVLLVGSRISTNRQNLCRK